MLLLVTILITVLVDQLCDNTKDCPLKDDEVFCKYFTLPHMKMCWKPIEFIIDLEHFFCHLGHQITRPSSTHSKTYSSERNAKSNLASNIVWWCCNRGAPLQVRMDRNISTLFCLCPPSYYGDRCQYQSQRVSLTIQIRASSEWRSTYTFLITLMGNEGNIESHDHISYLPMRDCSSKFNLYLLYSTRPKNCSINWTFAN